MTLPEVRAVAAELARAASDGGPAAEDAARKLLGELDGRSWLLLDGDVRALYRGLTRSGAELAGSTVFAALVNSFHADGRVRQRASRALGGFDGPVVATALAVRLLDHVAEVRDEARSALLRPLRPDTAAVVLDVLLAGHERRQAPPALAWARAALLDRLPAAELVGILLDSGRRDARRWAFTLGRESGVLPARRLLSLARSDPDQWVRAAAASSLLTVADLLQLRALLAVPTAEARLVAVTRLPDDALGDADLLPLLADRASRVREQAAWRARRRGVDVTSWYLEQIAAPGTPGHVIASSLEGLAATGGPEHLDVFGVHLRHGAVRVRAAAVGAVGLHAPKATALAVLVPVLLDPSPRVSAAAARALARLEAPRSAAADAWTSDQAWSRRAAWRLDRAAGSWDRVEADLRAAADRDPRLAALGRAGVHTWLVASAASTWAVLGEAQRGRIQELLGAGPLDVGVRRTVAFHAGLPRHPAPPPPATPAPPPAAPPAPPPAGTEAGTAQPSRAQRLLRLMRPPRPNR